MIALDSRPSRLGLSPGWLRSIVLVQNILPTVPLFTQVYKGYKGICELHAA